MYGLIEIYDDEHYLVKDSSDKIREFTEEGAEEYVRRHPTNAGYFLFTIVKEIPDY